VSRRSTQVNADQKEKKEGAGRLLIWVHLRLSAKICGSLIHSHDELSISDIMEPDA